VVEEPLVTDRDQILVALLACSASPSAQADFDKQREQDYEFSPPAGIVPPPAEPLPEAAERQSEVDDRDSLWSEFEQRLVPLGGRMATLEDLQQLEGKRLWIDKDVRTSLQHNSSDIWEAEVGITTAQIAVAETGTLLLSAGPDRARLASLAPPIHVVIIDRSAIVATLDEAMRHVTDRTSVFITGPSRTADIEGILIRGVHGPGELWVVVTD
jgi:L-lactate utilization protein LutC